MGKGEVMKIRDVAGVNVLQTTKVSPRLELHIL
jgi:hypothetical protein